MIAYLDSKQDRKSKDDYESNQNPIENIKI